MIVDDIIANLFPKDEANSSLLDFSMNQDNISETIQAISSYMDQKSVAKNVNNKICIAIEEMAVFTYNNNREKTAHMDVSLKIKDGSFVLVFLDDGKPTDIIEIHNDNKDVFKMDEVAMLMAVSNSAEYNNVIGLNKLQLKFDGIKLD